jgi:hypothetical protein
MVCLCGPEEIFPDFGNKQPVGSQGMMLVSTAGLTPKIINKPFFNIIIKLGTRVKGKKWK